ncbi:hypothetical protein C7446_2146 [Kushneria sinocarnis]|uniref:Uncharacterized protein n=1 Tax=Kushneria sinocarnis TaxID=595502 RepID=A0A420WV63_9GAMM|nr:hypothetical protein [Kushneria sinocarnis]RKR02432.1 hypothetical protein C7446_2146 [Kushneria sinocarnis]
MLSILTARPRPTFSALILALTTLLSAATAIGEPPGHHRSPTGSGFSEPGHQGHGRPGDGHGLPDDARAIWIGSALYFLAGGSWFLWHAETRRYAPVVPPRAVQNTGPETYDVIAYPARGQSEAQQARDRYACHRWSVGQSGFDPATTLQAPTLTQSSTYRRALAACLEGHGYTAR